MKDAAKALEIAMSFIDSNAPTLDKCVESAKQMASWKEKQMIQKAVEFLSKRVFSYDGCFIEDFKQAMEE